MKKVRAGEVYYRHSGDKGRITIWYFTRVGDDADFILLIRTDDTVEVIFNRHIPMESIGGIKYYHRGTANPGRFLVAQTFAGPF